MTTMTQTVPPATRHIDPLVRALIERRHALGWSQAELATRMIRDAAQISGYERGVNVPGLRVLSEWAAALGVELAIRETGAANGSAQ